MFRPWLRVARPDDWTGAVARFGLWPIYFLALLGVGLARIPPRLWLLDSESLTRMLIALVVVYLLGWLRMITWTFLPGAVIQYGRRLWFRHAGRRLRLRIADIQAIDVESRPPPLLEVFVIELANGSSYDLCPVRWDGAERVYALVARRVRRARLRARRRAARAQKRGEIAT